MAQSIPDLKAQLGVTTAPSGGKGLALDPNGRIPATLLPRYLPYTPTWTATGTAPAIGNATVLARYTQLGKLVHAYGNIAFGSSSAFGTGRWLFALPVTPSASETGTPSVVGSGVLYDASADMYFNGVAMSLELTGQMRFTYGAGYLSGVTQFASVTTPWTWATSDQVLWNITYESA